MKQKIRLSNLSKKTVVFLLVVLLAAIGCAAAFAAGGSDAVYTTKDGTWTQVDENTWTMEKDGKNITLIKNGDTWQYLFEVDDPNAEYHAWEEEVPEGYEVVDGQGTRANPIILNKKTTKVSHTPNISDSGEQTGNYAGSLNLMDVVKIDGATSLHVSITYSGESTSYDWVCMWKGDVSGSYTAASNYSSSLTGKLGGTTRTTKEYDVDGDTVTFGFKSDGGGYGDGYGYYAVVTANSDLEDPVITNRTTDPLPELSYGGLTLKKILTGSAADPGQNFQFNITLSSEDTDLAKLLSGSRTYGDVSLKDGKGVVYLKGGESVSMTDIPAGVTWTIAEQEREDYVTTFTGGTVVAGKANTCTGTIEADQTKEVAYTNKKDEEVQPSPDDPDVDKESFAVTKTVKNGSDTDAFTFSAALWKLTAGKNYFVTVTHADASTETKNFTAGTTGMGYLEFDLKNGEKAEFTGLPVNAQYQILEKASEGYTASFEITGAGVSAAMSKKENFEENQELSTAKETLEQDEKALITFTNSKPEVSPDRVEIPVQKVWVDEDNAAGKRPENITVRLLQDEDIIATAVLDEANGWKTVFDNLDKYHEDGTTEYAYSIEEISVPGYTSEVVKATDTNEYTITNTYSNAKTGDLKLSKTVTEEGGCDIPDLDLLPIGDEGLEGPAAGEDSVPVSELRSAEAPTGGADTTKSFRFTVELKKDDQPVTGTFNLDAEKGTKTGTVFFDENGQATLSLKHGESAYITGLPDGAAYTITETAYADWTPSLSAGAWTGTISETLSNVAVLNTYSGKANITVSKTVSGSMGNKSQVFHFQLILTDCEAPASLKATKDGTDSTITGNSGVYEFTLSHGETIQLLDIPIRATYEIKETDGQSTGYTVTTDVPPTGTLEADLEVNFKNVKNGTVPTLANMNLLVPLAMILLVVGIMGSIFLKRNRMKK